MKKKLLDLLAKKKSIVDQMRTADAAGDQAAFDAAQAELAPVDEEIARVRAIMAAEEGGTGADEYGTRLCELQRVHSRVLRMHPRGRIERPPASCGKPRHCAPRGAQRGRHDRGHSGRRRLIVPADIQTLIREQMRALNPLSELFSIKNVTSITVAA